MFFSAFFQEEENYKSDEWWLKRYIFTIIIIKCQSLKHKMDNCKVEHK